MDNFTPNQPWLLVSDLDDTLLGNDRALERFRKFFDEKQPYLDVVYASGRFCHSIDQDLRDTALPDPLATIGGVGSEIWLYPDRQPLKAWWEEISSDWSAEKIRELLKDESDLEIQPDANQSLYKVSYYLDRAKPDRLRELEDFIQLAGIRSRHVYSSQRDLDILPAGVDKGSAADFLIEYLDRPRELVLSSGNSGNDATLFDRDFAGIIVANAHDDLKACKDKNRVYLADTPHADGVREGIEYWMERLSS